MRKQDNIDFVFEDLNVVEDYIVALNYILKKKEKVIGKYKVDYPVSLLIRSSTPDLSYEKMKLMESRLYIPNNCNHIWILLDDSMMDQRWTNLVKIK